MSLCRASLFSLCLLPALGAFALWHHGGGVQPESSATLRGRYVEARSASVFAGPCHFNSEYTTQGREAVMAFAIDGGSEEGVDLSGLRVVAAVAAGENLAEDGADRSSVVYVPLEASEAQRAAAVRALVRRCGSSLGQVREVRAAEVEVESDGTRFSVLVASDGQAIVELRGAAMADRACCTMPSNVWYEPLAPLLERVVGHCERLLVREPLLGQPFTRSGENSAFLGTFGGTFGPRSCCASPCGSRESAPLEP